MYRLDTNTCIYINNRKPHSVVEPIKTLPPHHVKLSAVSLAELQYGVAKSSATDKNRAALLQFASAFEIVPFDDTDAEVFAHVRAALERKWHPMGPSDMQIDNIDREILLCYCARIRTAGRPSGTSQFM